ncbi:MAG: penicillin acylase family protein [Cyclobacteriaceae bacterium]|nr:penicillin acylase family protein [Cyclobacteriaceae bacterium]
MKLPYLLLAATWMLISCVTENEHETTFDVSGLEKPVEIFRDSSGVNHIYAQTEHDLFFAQGYAAARDRLFQLELWRRQATGTMAEWLGPRELKRDIGARLFKYRGDLKTELNHYHPHGEQIIRAFTEGINAWISETEKNPELLPLEFHILNFRPGKWTPEVVISRHQALVANLTDELNNGRAVALLGAKKVKDLRNFEPGTPRLDLDRAIDPTGLFEPVIEVYEAYRKPVAFLPEDISEKYRTTASAASHDNQFALLQHTAPEEERVLGSNNWVVAGSKSVTGKPLLANDPHRAITLPSLRYIVHLSGPGWNVIGGGEPAIPGVSIGHNEYGAWGLTVFRIDAEDLIVYDINPVNTNQYRYRNAWEDMKLIYDTIHIKGAPDTVIIHRYTRHGPVTYMDYQRKKAYAVRCAWLEPGNAPYLASLRMNTAKTWEEFREACTYSYLPGENMIWADRNGNIGWQVVGLAPIRKNWDGLVPVPGDGRYEWEGYLPIKELPHVFNPQQGFWATANENLVVPDYAHRYAVGWEWADSSRGNRIREVLQSKATFPVDDMKKLQTDYVSLPARTLVNYLRSLKAKSPITEKARQMLINWNGDLNKNSVEAGIYMMWERTLLNEANSLFVPQQARNLVRVSLRKVIEWIKADRRELRGRARFLLETLEEACAQLEKKFGSDMSRWIYGQPDYHHVVIRHPLYSVVSDSFKEVFTCGPLPRGGSGSTPGMTGNSDNQTHGATFRIVADVTDWDNCWFTNAPGQSGDAASPFFRNLFEPWANDRYFRSYFSRDKILKSAYSKTVLRKIR